MIAIYIFYLVIHYFFVSKKLFNVCSLGLLYILVSIIIGKYSVDYSAQWVSHFDLSYVSQSVFYLKLSFYILIFVILFMQLIFPENKLKKSTGINLGNLIAANSSWLLILILAIPLYIVFVIIYFPALESETHVSKYFQDRLVEFIPFRPYYTLSINALSTILFLQINYFLLKNKNLGTLSFFLNKQAGKILFIAISLFFTAKRGQLFFPFFISFVAFLIYKGKTLKLIIYGSAFVVLISLSRNINRIISGNFNFEDVLMSFSTSFFVSVRELSRVLYSFEEGGHSFLVGKTYIAGFLSFIPTSINELKANYNYMRYSSIISGQNPDDFGGMRSTYVGEAYINFNVFGIFVISLIFGLIIYLINLWIQKYSNNKFVSILFTIWCLKLIILPFYENGSSMFLFFLITTIFMILPSLILATRNGKLLLKIKFLNVTNV